jgi:mRNA interferase YafQ
MPEQEYHVATSRQFRRDLRRLKRLDRYDLQKLNHLIKMIKSGKRLPEQYRNHKLHGRYEGCDECHIQNDWLLIYRTLEDVLILQLMRTGRHTDVFEE